MKQQFQRSTHLIMLVLSIAVAVVIGSCDNFNLYQQFPSLDAAVLRITPAIGAVYVTKTLNFEASGGAGGYVFSVVSGGGTIDPLGGVFTAPAVAGDAVVRVTDMFGDRRDSPIVILEPTDLVISPDTIYVGLGAIFDFAAFGGVFPYTFSVVTDGPGVDGTINPTTGLYSAPATYDASDNMDIVRVTDAALSTTTATVTIVEAGGPLHISPESPTVAEFDTLAFFGSGGTGSYTFSVLPDADPSPDGYITSGYIYHPNGARGTNADQIQVSDTVDTATTFVTVLPAGPENLVADGGYDGPQDIRIAWNDVSVFAQKYRLERQESGTGTWVVVDDTIAAGMEEYIDTGLLPNTLYIYRVIALFDDGIAPSDLESAPSDPVSALSNG